MVARVVVVPPPVSTGFVVNCVVAGRVVFPGGEIVASVPEDESLPLPPESTTARITPPTAAAATAAASTAFLTGSEATLARPWPHTWKSS